MKNVDEIEQAVRQLSPAELELFRQWFADFDAAAWDRQIEQDVAAGKLESLADEALREFENGKAREL